MATPAPRTQGEQNNSLLGQQESSVGLAAKFDSPSSILGTHMVKGGGE